MGPHTDGNSSCCWASQAGLLLLPCPCMPDFLLGSIGVPFEESAQVMNQQLLIRHRCTGSPCCACSPAISDVRVMLGNAPGITKKMMQGRHAGQGGIKPDRLHWGLAELLGCNAGQVGGQARWGLLGGRRLLSRLS